MRATVWSVAVVSLVAAGHLSSQESASSVPGSGQQKTQPPTSVGTQFVRVDTIGLGGKTIPAGDTVRGPVVVAAGDLRVLGTIQGTAIALIGDVVVEPGGRITGDAISVFGSVTAPAGAVLGELHAVSGAIGNRLGVEREAPRSVTNALSLSLGWLAVMLVIGIGVLVFASSYLEGVTDVLEQSFWRSFLVGVAGELAILPACVLLLVALAITVVGILLIPFAVVAYVIAIAGLGTLGFLAAAYLTGGSIGSRRADNLQARGRAFRSLVIGVGLYMGLWVFAAIFEWSPWVSGALRGLALAVTYAAATAGFGAAILSRGGTRRDATARRPVTAEMASWQTPTPVTGVVAARRPTPVNR